MKALLLALLCILLVAAASRDDKNINVELRAKWTGTPLLLELSELLAKEGSELFWKLIELEPKLTSETSEGCFKDILAQGKSLVGGPLSSVVELSLVARTASPKLVLYRQLARESLQAHSLLDSSFGGDNDRWTINENPPAPQGKCCWVDIGSKILLEFNDVENWLENGPSLETDLELFDFDHVYPLSGSAERVAILYGALGTECFRKLHETLQDAAKQGRVKYVVRPVLPSGCEASTCAKLGTGKSLKLSGYGVQLALKNMEYKAIDDSELREGDGTDESRNEDLTQDVRGFVFSTLLERKPQLASELMTFRDHLLSSDISENMNVWELKDLGYQAAQRIVGASEPLRLMQELNQNFPKLVSSLSRMKINETIKEEIVSNQQMVPPGRNLFAINGALVNPENLDMHTLIHMVHEEFSFADKIAKMKVPSDAIKQFLQLPDAAEPGAIRLDFRSEEFVHYLNNLEEDAKYARWRTSLNELLMPTFPGQMRYLRKNLYHAVYVIDPASMKDLKMVQSILHYYRSNVPMRFGLILMSPKAIDLMEQSSGEIMDNADLSSLVIRLFIYMKERHGVEKAFDFLNSILDDDDSEDDVQPDNVEEAFLDTLNEMTKTDAMKIFKEIKNSEDYKDDALKSSQFVYNLGLSQMHPTLLMNGLVYGPSQAQSGAIAAMNEELPKLQEAIYFGHINSRTDILDKFLSEEGFSRYNPKILSTGKDTKKYISLATPVAENPILAKLPHWHSPGTEDDVKPVTHWIIADLTQAAGVRLLNQGIQYLMQGSTTARLGLIHNVKAVPTEGSTESLLINIVSHLSHSSSRRAKHAPFLQKFLSSYAKDLSYDEVLNLATRVANDVGLKAESLKAAVADSVDMQLQQEKSLSSSLFGLNPGSNAVITNGRVFAEDAGQLISAGDFGLLETVEYKRRAKDIQAVVEEISWDNLEPDDVTSDFLSTVLMTVSSTMASRTRSSDTANFQLLKAEHGAIVRHVEGSLLHIDAVIDPLSAVGQKMAPLLLLLEEWLRPSIRIVLNPMNSLADVPLKNFYRYVLPSKDEFVSGSFGPFARFTNMPPSRTLTMNLDVPEPWLVEPVVAIHDLDNIVLEKLGKERTLNAVFELEALMITGHCFENNEPPRGLQLILGTTQIPHMVDTIVMANLGYFQLKAAPGAWTLRLADGRSSELYTLAGPKEGTDEGPVSRKIGVADMRGELVNLEAVKRRGKEDEKLLDGDTKKSKSGPAKNTKKSFLDGFKWLVGGEKRRAATNGTLARQGETINIFSVASGHLYERFLKIMILSVLKNTNRPVKFWFIKNYLSPQFKDLIPHMAAKYDFEYELVTYKWPSWLHKQTEKQRIIWAYKILFLDVIFPLSLKKVIFVDADQIIRTDMGDLYDMDIKGKPLAYTPFCDNNREMDGYRFWSQGFWREHLQGKPYHISALYVVDLDKFRQTAAGDNLRVFYENLSKDPNSLSNLDQDLPNYAQHAVPIFSLPQEWLWCESWCGNATKAKAKTIDLCNNPMTKEPKLQGARRIVAEWPALDEEARLFTKEILGNDDDNMPVAPTQAENEKTDDGNVPATNPPTGGDDNLPATNPPEEDETSDDENMREENEKADDRDEL